MKKLSTLVRTALTAAMITLASGCALVPSKGNENVTVSVKGVNYSGDVVVFSVDDPAAPKNATGGDRASPYSGAGVQCCINLPRVWRPGINLVIDAIVYPVDEDDFTRDLPRYMKKFPVEVPQYPEDQPVELWVIRTAQGDMNLVASNVDPTHEAWPGAIKGLPEPSRAFKMRRWKIKFEETEKSIAITKKFLKEGMSSSSARQEEWDIIKRYLPNDVTQFSGPDDPEFSKFLLNQRKGTLRHLEARLKELMESEP